MAREVGNRESEASAEANLVAAYWRMGELAKAKDSAAASSRLTARPSYA